MSEEQIAQLFAKIFNAIWFRTFGRAEHRAYLREQAEKRLGSFDVILEVKDEVTPGLERVRQALAHVRGDDACPTKPIRWA